MKGLRSKTDDKAMQMLTDIVEQFNRLAHASLGDGPVKKISVGGLTRQGKDGQNRLK